MTVQTTGTTLTTIVERPNLSEHSNRPKRRRNRHIIIYICLKFTFTPSCSASSQGGQEAPRCTRRWRWQRSARHSRAPQRYQQHGTNRADSLIGVCQCRRRSARRQAVVVTRPRPRCRQRAIEFSDLEPFCPAGRCSATATIGGAIFSVSPLIPRAVVGQHQLHWREAVTSSRPRHSFATSLSDPDQEHQGNRQACTCSPSTTYPRASAYPFTSQPWTER